MMLTILGLPPKTRFSDIKALIKQECGIIDFILDSLLPDKDSKRVKIGVSDESDGFRVMKCLNGFRMSGTHVLRVEPVKALKTDDTRSNYEDQSRNDYNRSDYRNEPEYSERGPSGSHSTVIQNSRPNFDSRPPMDRSRMDRPPMERSHMDRPPLDRPPIDRPSMDARHNPMGHLDSRHQPMDNRYSSLHNSRQTGPISMDSRPMGPLGMDSRQTGPLSMNSRPTGPHGMDSNIDSRYPDSRFSRPGPESQEPMGRLSGPIHGQIDSRLGPQSGPGLQSGPDPRFGPQFQDHSNTAQKLGAPMDRHGVPNMHSPQNQMAHPNIPEPSIRSQQWTPNVPSNNQWPGSQITNQGPQSTYNMPQQNINTGFNQQQPSMQQQAPYGQGGPHQESDFSFQREKSFQRKNIPEHPKGRGALRAVDIVDSPRAPTYTHDKPITIMKDNFQGPTPYNMSGHVPPQSQIVQPQAPHQAWGPQAQQSKPFEDRRQMLDKRPEIKPPTDFDKHRYSPSRMTRSPPRSHELTRTYTDKGLTDRVMPTMGRNIQGREMSPGRRSPGRRLSPGRRVSPSGRRISPSGRRISPSGRRISPPGRRNSPSGRRISPSVRRISPPGRRISPGRRMSPSDRRLSPRRMSPGRKQSPGRLSPGRRVSPRRSDPSMMHYYREDDRRAIGRGDGPRFSPHKRPNSPPRHSPGRSRFSPGRHTDKSTDKYVDEVKAKSIRPAYDGPSAQTQYSGGYRPNLHENIQYPINRPDRVAQWQKDKFLAAMKKEEDNRGSPRGGSGTGERKSRSRSRSPIKDRFRRHSPSPRSPRRSWALEKRRSPEMTAPPPPVWPGQETDTETRRNWDRPNPETQRDREPVWDRSRRDAEHHRYPGREADLRDGTVRSAELRRDTGRDNDLRRDPGRNIDLRRETGRDDDLRRFDDKRDDTKPKFTRSNWEERTDDVKTRDYRDDDRRLDNKISTDIDKDFQDIYKRAVEFRKKTEELRKSNEKRRDEYKQTDKYEREESPQRAKIEAFKREVNMLHFNRMIMSAEVRAKRDKAVAELSKKILARHDFRGEHKQRVAEELELAISKALYEMFGDKDVAFIELVIKYQSKYSGANEDKILMDVLSSLPSHYSTGLKRKHEDVPVVPVKKPRVSPQPGAKQEPPPRPKLSDSSRWDMAIKPPKVADMSNVTLGVNSQVAAGPVAPVAPVYQGIPQNLYPTTFQQIQGPAQIHGQFPSSSMMQMQSSYHMMPDMSMQMHPQLQDTQMQSQYSPGMSEMGHYSSQFNEDEGFNLYLCQDDFEPFAPHQADNLRTFLINQIIQVTESNEGWSPDFTFKGLNTPFRYEVTTKDPVSKDWLINLDFREFEYFNVLVYTKEELWYERAAIWLPGHSRVRNIEPLAKLALQNKHLLDIDIGKWKFVKKIVTVKGIRLYVDMPPSSARALENHKMMLSYELSKVNVILKAVAVDKDAFDSGLKQPSLDDVSVLTVAAQNSPMSTLSPNDPEIIKLCLNGSKSLTMEQARKIKEVVIYNLFKYHQAGGTCKTDFVKYGYCPPSHLGIVPENDESKRWLAGRNFGKLNRQTIIVVGSDDMNTRYFRMFAYIPGEFNCNKALVFERIKQSNQGIKGLHFNLWKPIDIHRMPCKSSNDKKADIRKKTILELDMDLESVETLAKMKYSLDYVSENYTVSATFKSEYSYSKLEEKLQKCKAEQMDSYDVANMDLDSNSDTSSVVALS